MQGRQGQLQKNYDRHPMIGDNVILYSGATVLGRISIGAQSIVGSQARVSQDVPANSKVYHIQ